MRAIPILLAALWLAPSAAAQTLPAVQRAVEGEACPIAPYDPDAPEGTLQEPEWWSAPERYAWREICTGNVADMQFSTGADDGAGCRAFTPNPEDPAQLLASDAWPESRQLRPRFLRQIAARQPFIDAPVRPAVRVGCAHVIGRLDLADETVPQTLSVWDSRVPGALIANARFGRDLAFDGSHVYADVSAGTARVEGALYLRNGRFGAISLLGAEVAGPVATDGSTLTGLFDADRLRAGGILAMSDMPAAAGIDLLGADVAGTVATDGSTLTGLFNADGLRVGGSLLMRNMPAAAGIRLRGAGVAGDVATVRSTLTGQFDAGRLRVGGSLYMHDMPAATAIRLRGADVAGSVATDGATLTGPFEADGLRVGGNLYLRDMPAAAGIDLIVAEVEGAVQFHGASLMGRVDLTGAVIGEALELSQGADRDTTWRADAALILRNARAGALQARIPDSFRAGDKTDPAALVPTDMNGFAYARLGGLGSGTETDLARIEAGVFVDWLDTLPFPGEPERQGYRPQPYTQLASVLRDMGAEAAAEAVEAARFRHRTESRAFDWHRYFGNDYAGPGEIARTAFVSVVDWLNRWVVGFGVYPERALAWFTGLVLLGWAVARRSPDLRGQGAFKPFFYSLENALPLIDLSGQFADIRHADAPRIANFFHFQKAAGFVLATVLVGALTILGG